MSAVMPRQARLDAPGVMHHVMYQTVVGHEDLDCAERLRASHLNPCEQGPIRTLGGWAAGVDRRETGHTRRKRAEPIVGAAEWVEAIVKPAQEHATRYTTWTRRGGGVAHRVARAAEIFRVESHGVVAQGRQRRRGYARSLRCCWAVRALGGSRAETARNVGMRPSGVGYAVHRGEALVRGNRDELGR